MRVAGEGAYYPLAPSWGPILGAIRTSEPDVLVLSSHIPDGIAFRRAFLAAGLHVRAFIGSTMAQCLPDFGRALGADAAGVFASDRPPDGFNPGALDAQARALYGRFAAAWRQQTHGAPTEEGISGFTAAWVLFHDVLPRAARLDPLAIAAAAKTLDIAAGSLPNGAGVRFADTASELGQNIRAAAVIWQWQPPGGAGDRWDGPAGVRNVVVWPALYATGPIEL
jgi:branched-chain amino acid transport system substrate-binding protein